MSDGLTEADDPAVVDKPIVNEAARQIASGEAVDWRALDPGTDGGLRGLLQGLQHVEGIAAFHRDWRVGLESPAGDLTGTWGGLTLLEEIGRGSFGRVYRARDSRLDREVALKILERGPTLDSPQATAVVEEGRHLARLRHPNIVTIHRAERLNGRVSLEMELVTGRTLSDIVRTRGPFSQDEAALICRDVCRALAAVHQAGLVHRDVKAQNVVRERGGRIVLMDFGAGRLADVLASAEVAGTPLYLAPEVLAGLPPTRRSDLYSLGVLLYYLVAGEFPIPARTVDELRKAHQTGAVRRLREARPGLSDRFVNLVECALALDPANRIASAGSFEAELSRTLGEAAPDPPARSGGDLSDGQPLVDLVEAHGELSAEEAALVGRDVCRILASTQAVGRAHHAVTPRTVVRRRGGQIELSGADVDPRGAAARPRSDLRQIGELLYYLVIGSLPVEGGAELRDVRPGLPEGFSRVVERAFDRHPPRTAERISDVAAQLSQVISASGVEPHEKAPTWSRTVGAGFVGVVVLAALAWAEWMGAWRAGDSPHRSSTAWRCGAEEPARTAGPGEGPSSWQRLQSLPTARFGFVAAVLDCRLFTMGGATRIANPPAIGQYALNVLEAYDPRSDVWTTMAPLPAARVYSTGAAVIDGRIYVPGGSTCKGHECTDADSLFIFDPAAGPRGTWTAGPPMPASVQEGTSGVIDGMLYVTAGWSSGGFVKSFFKFDPAARAWTPLAEMPRPHVFAASAVIGNKLYVAGGEGNHHGLDIYDPASGSWASKTMPVGYHHHAAAAVGERLVLFGGHQFVSGAFASARIVMAYDTRTDTWTTPDPVPSPGGPYTGTVGVDVAFSGRSTQTFARLPTELDLTTGARVGSGIYVAGAWDTTNLRPVNVVLGLNPAAPEPLAYHWSLGDGLQARGPNPRHRYTVAGRYTVTLIVQTQDGRFGSTTTSAVITPAR